MGRASTYTHLPIDTWAKILGISPWEFNQMNYPGHKSAQCKDVFFQFQWQKDHLGREEVAQAIADAERMVADACLFWPAPHYVVNEEVQYSRPYQRSRFGFAGDIRGDWKTVSLKWHRFRSGGAFNRTALGTIRSAGIEAADKDKDNIKETFTATFTNAAIGDITDTNELAIYFAASDRHGEALSETWRIRPVQVSIIGTTVTFTGHRTLLVKPNPEFSVNPEGLTATEDGNYVTSLECCRVFTDTTATDETPYQGVAVWKDDPYCQAGCTFSQKSICLGRDSDDQSRVFASFGDPCTWPFPRDPNKLYVNYVAGLPLENGQMQPDMARVITYLSVSLLANEKCGCERTNRILDVWKARITRFEDNSAKATSFAPSENPFPMTAGGQYAWARVRDWRDLEAVGVG